MGLFQGQHVKFLKKFRKKAIIKLNYLKFDFSQNDPKTRYMVHIVKKKLIHIFNLGGPLKFVAISKGFKNCFIGSKVTALLPDWTDFAYSRSCIRKGLLTTKVPRLVINIVVSVLFFVGTALVPFYRFYISYDK